MKITYLLEEASKKLKKAGIETYELDARLLLQFLTGMSRSALLLYGNDELDALTVSRFFALIEERSQRVPLHYITGSREFWSLDFIVNPAVLVPRPETEFLLSHLLEAVSSGPKITRAVDMCTGSGVIAAVLAREIGCKVTAVDVSFDALEIASYNCRKHVPGDKITLVCSDLFAALNDSVGYDLVVCNPPYIADGEIPGLEPEVSRYEPLLALAGGADGLSVITNVILQATRFLNPGGYIFLEIGSDQAEAITGLFEMQKGVFEDIRVTSDWAGRDRVVQARLR